MNSDKGGNFPRMEDYGSPATEDEQGGYGDRTDTDVTPMTNQGVGAGAAADRAGEGSNFTVSQGEPGEGTGSDTGLHGGQFGGESESTGQFGEFGHTGIGTDLTREMDEMGGTDARSGMVKGGRPGDDDVAGAGQYGGEAGSVSDGETH